jgi:hypothetical protein
MGHNRPLLFVSRLLFPGYCFLSYYSVHPRKRKVVLSQLPHVLWASGCWHYERTLYSRRPLKGTGVSIYLSLQHTLNMIGYMFESTFGFKNSK